MAKNDAPPVPAGKPEMVEIPVEQFRKLTERLDALEQSTRINSEALLNSRAKILDPAYEKWKARAGRTALERTQELADERYGVQGQRFRVRLDPTLEDGKKGPHIGEHFPLVLSAHSDLEAQARYLEIMGIRKHDYRVVAEPVAA